MREGPIQAADLPLRKLAAIDALARAGHADPAMLNSITIDPNLWPDSAVIDWWSILLRVPQIPDRDRRLKDAEHIMRARLNEQGTAMHLSSDARNDMWWLMVSPDCNMVRLALLLIDNNLWHDDLPLVMRGALALQAHGAWTETITNAWGTLAVRKFASAFESTPIAGVTNASIQAATQKLNWGNDPKGGMLAFDWPCQRFRSEDRPCWKRPSVGADSSARGSTLYANVFERLSGSRALFFRSKMRILADGNAATWCGCISRSKRKPT